VRIVRGVAWEEAVAMAVAAVVGVYAGIAAGLFAACIRLAQLALFHTADLLHALVAPGFARSFAVNLEHAHWHLEFALLAAVALLLSLPVPSVAAKRLIPRFESDRLRSVARAGAFGLALYYPLLLLQTFNNSFPDTAGGLFAMLVSAPLWVIVLAPAAGALAAGAIVRYVSPASAGHGVLEVIEAVHTRKQLPGPVAFWKSIAAGLTIGSGGSAGREGPVVHLGGAVAAALARYLSLPRERAVLLLACGAGAGIAASFQAPLAGSLFAVEIVLGGAFTVRGFAAIVLSCVMATVTSRSLLQDATLLHAAQWVQGSPLEMGLYLLLGLCAGFVALAYIRAMDAVHHVFDRLRRVPRALRPAIGGLLVGLLGLLAPRALGTGVESLNAALAGQLPLAALLLALVVKLAATALTLGSGAPGGSFFPAVFLGAMLGGAFGHVAHLVLPGIAATPEAYAAVGMGAVVAGSTSAPLTGVLIMFELTGSHFIVLPLLLACGVAAAQVHAILGGSLYSLQLEDKGITSSTRDQALRSLSVAQALEAVPPILESMRWVDLVRLVSDTRHPAFPVVSASGALTGILSVREVRSALLDPALCDVTIARDLARQNPVGLATDDDLESALRRLSESGFAEAVVLSTMGEPLGVLTREAVLDAWRRASSV
jgi:CIC family chloride channel protein